jgi:molybdopterin molybdotransferase
MITVAEADRLLRLHVRPGGCERVPLPGAVGRVLAEEVAADRPYPPFDRVAMDGVAIAHDRWRSGVRTFRIASTQRAGEAPHRLVATSDCVEIMTGAALPEGCDTVVRYEDLRLEDGTATIADRAEVVATQNVHPCGSDAGAGAVLLRTGTVLRPTHIAALASVGAADVVVATIPRVAVLTTGDELVAVDAPVLPHQIRQSNGHAVCAALAQSGYSEVALEHVRDEDTDVRAALEAVLAGADVVLVTGGVSAGRFDLIPSVLAELGVDEVFHKIRQKPGKPLWFGVAASGQAVFGLPGNPVSALVCVYRYALPYLAACACATVPARPHVQLSGLPRRSNDFTHFVPVVREGLDAHLVATNGSGDFVSLLPSDGFVEVSAEAAEPGPVPYFSWHTA